MKSRKKTRNAGKLRIGDDWNAISIIALSQSNPLKAVAEFVENSIDARARNITITRGREAGQHYLRVVDDGAGIPRDDEGIPNFKYVATHICDSIKRRLKDGGAEGIQGEFGIGLLSFWTVGEALTLASTSTDGKTYEMQMRKGGPNYEVAQRRFLFPDGGTRLEVKPLLSGIRQFSGEKIQWYLASELRDRIRQSGVRIKVLDRTARKEYKVVPRQFSGRLLHSLPRVTTKVGEAYLELYLAEQSADNHVELHRSGTRVLANIGDLDVFQRPPWTEGYLQGLIDVPFLSLTPGTRSGIIQDGGLAQLVAALEAVEEELAGVIAEQRKAEEERASRRVLQTIRKAFREAILSLPVEEYDWFDIQRPGEGARLHSRTAADSAALTEETVDGDVAAGTRLDKGQKQFFEYCGPLYSVRVSPASCVVPVKETRTLRAVARDKSRRLVEARLRFAWEIVEGDGRLENRDGEIATFHAPREPGLTRIKVAVSQDATTCEAEGLVTVTDTILPKAKERSETREGLPGYTFRRAPGQLWRSRYDETQNVIVINNGHRDFVYASRNKSRKIRYICRLFCKELVKKNFPGESPSDLLERMVELSLYTEENLR